MQYQANDLADHFGVHNIPFGIGSRCDDDSAQCVSRIGNDVIYVADLYNNFAIEGLPRNTLYQTSLNALAMLGRQIHDKVRKAIQDLEMRNCIPRSCKQDISTVKMQLPVSIDDFTDFSCSSHHNRNAGQALMGASRELSPGYLHMPLVSISQT